MFEWDEDDNKWTFAHILSHAEGRRPAILESDPGRVSSAYDMVCNGYELASAASVFTGANCRQIFKALVTTLEEMEIAFGHMLDAFRYGAPPLGHGRASTGLVMLIADEPNIRVPPDAYRRPVPFKCNSAVARVDSAALEHQVAAAGVLERTQHSADVRLRRISITNRSMPAPCPMRGAP